jgi:hypothetical protein
MSNSNIPAESNAVVVLDQLTEQVRSAHDSVGAHESTALDSALEAGIALLAIQSRITGTMKRWMVENLSKIGVSTWKMYMQLAHHRAEIEDAREQNPQLSITAARQLIAVKKPRGNMPKGKKSFKGWSDDEIRDALLELEFDRFRRVIPEWYRTQLLGHSRAQILRVAQAQPPRTKLKDFVPRLVAGTDLEELPPTQH